MAVEVQIICQTCKRLVPVIDKRIMEHTAPGGLVCEHSGEKHIPQGFRGVPVNEYLNEIVPEGKGHWESVAPQNLPDLDTLDVVSSAPIFEDKDCTKSVGGLVVLRDKKNSDDVYAMKTTVEMATDMAPVGKHGRD